LKNDYSPTATRSKRRIYCLDGTSLAKLNS
jgi:hypothetical protein